MMSDVCGISRFILQFYCDKGAHTTQSLKNAAYGQDAWFKKTAQKRFCHFRWKVLMRKASLVVVDQLQKKLVKLRQKLSEIDT